MGRIPHRIAALRTAIVGIVRGQVAIARPGDAEHDARIGLLQRVLDGWQQTIGEVHVVGEVLRRIGARDRSIALIEELRLRDLAAGNRRFKLVADALRRGDHGADEWRVRRFHTAFGGEFDQGLAEIEEGLEAAVGLLEVGRGQIHSGREPLELLQRRIAALHIARGGARNRIDLLADCGERLMCTHDDSVHLLGRLRGFRGMLGGTAALPDQSVDLSAEFPHDAADANRCGPCLLGERLHFTGNDRKTATRLTGARRLDACVEREQPRLLRNGLDGGGNASDLLEHGTEGSEPLLHACDRCSQARDVLDSAADQST